MYKIWIYLVTGGMGLAAQTGQATRVPPDLNERTLQEKYHIAPTKEGLLGALSHPSAEVRNFAALKLAEDGYRDAIRPILAALEAETLEGNKVILAASAAKLESAEGFNALKSMCEDRNWPPGLRMDAAGTMVDFVGRQDCLPDIIDVLRSARDDQDAGAHSGALMALNLLASKRFKQIAPRQLNEIRDLSASYLKSQAPDLRMAAGEYIRDVGGPWAISQLRAAIDAEQDEFIRNSLAQDLASVGH